MASDIKEARFMNEILKEIISHIELPADHLKDQDPEIVEIFIEEVQEILEFLDHAIPQWLENPSDNDILKDIRRSFHTLKGSGRMAGATQSGELAWSIEEMLNRVMAGTVVLSKDIQELVYSVAKLYPVLVQDFQELKSHEIEFRPWMASAQRLRDEQQIEQPLRYTIDYYKDRATPDLNDVADVPVSEVAVAEEKSISQDDISHQQETNTLTPISEQGYAPSINVDHQTLEIFLEESNEHLITISTFLKHDTDRPLEQYNQLIRAIHTIRGSSGMVGFDDMFSASTQVENTFKNLSQEKDAEHESEQQLLLSYYEYVKSYTDILSENPIRYSELTRLTQKFDEAWAAFEAQSSSSPLTTDAQGLVASLLDLDINELLDAEFSFIEEISQHQHEYLTRLINQSETLIASTNLRQTESLNTIVKYLKQCYQNLNALPSFNAEDELLKKMQDLHLYLIDGFDGLASGQNISISHLLVEDFESMQLEIAQAQEEYAVPVAESTSEKVGLDSTPELDTESPENVSPLAHNENLSLQAPNTDFDPDLLSIFLEESDELVVGMDDDFNAWEKNTQNTQVLKNLFRYLHTLKGGANMVQATHLGMVAHELETIYERVLQGLLQPTAQDVQAIRYAQDDIAMRLQRLRDASIDEDNPNLIANLRAIYSTETAAPSTDYTVIEDVLKDVELEAVNNLEPTTSPISEQKIHLEIEDVKPANNEFDADLLAIFLEESDELVVGMDEDFSTWEKDTKNTQVLKNLFRYLHTLKGGANMVQATHLGMIAHELETIYERVLQGLIHPTPQAVQAIRSAQDDIATRLQRLADDSIDEDNPLLIAQLRAISLGGQLDVTEPDVPDDAIPVQTTEAPVTFEPVPDFVQAQVEDLAVESPITEQEPVLAEVSQEQAPSLSENNLPPVLAEAIQSGDEDKIIIVQSFYEEAEELLAEGTTLFEQWLNDRSNRSLMLGLQRIYHTIKGNARVIDQQLIALMAYQLELVFEQISIHEFKSDRYDSLIKHTKDWLYSAIFQGKYDGAESLKARLQAIDYQESLIPVDQQRIVTETIDFSSYQDVAVVEGDGTEPPAMYAQVDQKQEQGTQELIRVSADLVEKLIDLSGESAINRSRIELDLGQMTYTLSEMELAIQRLADQLRRMEGELEAQILAKHESEGQRYVDFDPLEMDQYSSLNQLSKSLAESASDLIDFKTTLADKIRDTENLLLQQSRLHTELQQSLMGTRLVPFARLVPRLQRLVRQTSTQLNRPVDLNIENTEGELDRNILERLVTPLEHMLRNAIDHGIEEQEIRTQLGKPLTGYINLNIAREGNDILVIFSDDGRGIDVEAVKAKALNNGLITTDMHLSDVDIMQYIFNSGLSTAQKVTQISGRGVGLDVVQNDIKALGGHVSVTSQKGKGTEFTIRVPTSVAVSNALMVKVGDQQFAIPLAQIERIVRVSPVALMEYYEGSQEYFELDDIQYRLRYIGEFITGQTKPNLTNMGSSVPVIIYNSGGRVVALQVDQLVGSRAQIVIKPIGQQLSSVGYVGGATILADGRVCLILDGQAIARRVLTVPRTLQVKGVEVSAPVVENRTLRRTIMVVDDSVTVRKVTSRLLERQGFDVVTAKDGVDAIEKLAQLKPELMLLDIEMPRMDGFEVAQYVRHDSQQRQLPIIMITSRTGEKHRERALALGVDRYMGKPFQEAELLENINELLAVVQAN